MKLKIDTPMKMYIATVLIFFCLLCSACTDKFEDFNTDQDSVTDDMLTTDMLGIGGFFPGMQMDVIPAKDVDANPFQRAQNLTGDIFSGYMAAIGDWNASSNNSTYDLYYGDWNDEGFKVAYSSIMTAWLKIKEKSEEYDLPSAYAVAQIIKIASMHCITDNHGPIPYFGFGSGDLQIPYDSQEDVYMSFFEELTAATGELEDFLEGALEARPLKNFDLIYSGDYTKWICYANSLKLRLAMRIVYADPEKAQKMAEQAVNNAYGVITGNEENALVKSANGIIVYNPLKVVWDSYGDARMGASIESFLIGYEDPWINKYFRPSTVGDGKYHGVRNGLVICDKSKYQKASVPNIEANTIEHPIQLMVAAEMYFLRAEGVLRGWNMAGNDGLTTARELYEAGIRASFEQHGVAGVDNYLINNTLVPADFADAIGSDNAAARTDITIAWDDNAGFDKKLERIITQKWLAMYLEGQEAWLEFRRTGYPKIFPVVRNNSGGTINTEVQVRRIPFPNSEYANNRTNVEEAVKLLNGPDNGGTKVWWDKK